jgi:hypothetical protein
MSSPHVGRTNFGTLKNLNLVAIEEEGRVIVDEPFFRALLASMITTIEFDPNFYTTKYADVKKAVKDGVVPSAHTHYVESGYFEGRLPRRIKVDERWYVATYPDVGKALKAELFKNAQQHFEENGYREGRLPSAGFVL